MTDFKSLKLNDSILKALDKKGYTRPTPIQEKSIPHIMNKKDLLGIAQTGTGKTAAFSLPLIHNLMSSGVEVKPKNVRALILTPTRELASQIEDNIKMYSKGTNFKTAVIFGGVGSTPQINKLKKGLDILIATPGRLLDLMGSGHVQYNQLECFILDEADRMLDMGFIHDIKKVIKKLPPKKHTLLFSATMPSSISKLASSLLRDPIRVEVTPESSTVDKIDQKINFVEKSNKIELLVNVLKDKKINSALVFSRTKHGADKIVRKLQKFSIQSAAIHGNKSQGARERALNAFRTGDMNILIATDIAARGIDVKDVSHVINFDLPNDPENYVHRIGRTARAGRDGVAISFCDESEKKYLKAIEKFIKLKIPVDSTHIMHGVAAKAPVHNQGRPQGAPKQKRNPKGHKNRVKKANRE